jgi:UDP-3-O-[3-hydroxymyristoyl] glucosamine N-acyltransferase
LEEGCVLGQGCHLERGCYISKNTVLDSHTKVLAGTRFSSRPFGLTPFFEESDLLFDRMLSEDF